jgi:hypothetical protein
MVSRNSQQQAGFIIGAKSCMQLAPRSLVLFGRPRMAKVIHPGELKQNVQAANESASGRWACLGVVYHDVGVGGRFRLDEY